MSIYPNLLEINLNPGLISVSLWVMVLTRRGIAALILLRLNFIPQWIMTFLKTPIFTPSLILRGRLYVMT